MEHTGNCERLVAKIWASETIQNLERLSTYMERFIDNNQSGTINCFVYGHYHIIKAN